MNASVAEFVISRDFNVPLALVWNAFTVPERMMQWWGPKGFAVIASGMDFRPNGVYHYCLRAPDGSDMWGKFIYREISVPEKIVLVTSFSDINQGVTRHPLNPNWPLEMLSTFTFTGHDGKTTFKVQWVPVNETEAEHKAFEDGRDSMLQGWTGTLDQLGEYLAATSGDKAGIAAASGRAVTITRIIDAPPERVWTAWTEPKQMAQWWGPSGFTTPVCELNVRTGGSIHIHMQGPDGTIYPMAGSFEELARPARLAFTGIPVDSDGNPIFEVLHTVTLTGHGSKTILVLRAKVVRETLGAAPYLDGMQLGWTQSLKRLADYVKGIK